MAHLQRYLLRRNQILSVPIETEFVGVLGLRLHQVMPLIKRHFAEHPAPSYLVLHVGANDIGYLDSVEWERQLQEIVFFLRAKLPHTFILWSDMLPRTQWRSISADKAKSFRQRNQRRARKLFKEEQGTFIKHPHLEHDRTLLSHDGVHLSQNGLAYFAQDLAETLTATILKD